MLNEIKDQIFKGADARSALYDVIYPHSDARLPLLIFCHGFKGFKDWGHFPELCRQIARAGYVVVRFNFSHNGVGLDQKNEFTDLKAFAENNYLKELKDLDALIDELKNSEVVKSRAKLDDIYLVGHSRGGSIALLKSSTDSRIKKVVSWAAVADFEDRLPSDEELSKWEEEGERIILNGRTGQKMPMNFQFVECLRKNRKQLQIEKAVKNMDKPMLIVHGEKDQSVALEHAYALHIWNPSAAFELIETANHTFGGQHPWDEPELPAESKNLLKLSLDFLRKS